MDAITPEINAALPSDSSIDPSDHPTTPILPVSTDDTSPSACNNSWPYFLEHAAVDFFAGYKLEKMTIEDGDGNKAKFSRTKGQNIKIEFTSSVLL